MGYLPDGRETREVTVHPSAVVEEAQRPLAERMAGIPPEVLDHLEQVIDDDRVIVRRHSHRPEEAEPIPPWINALLDVVPTPAALLRPVRDSEGAITEFRIERCNAEAADLVRRIGDSVPGDSVPGRPPREAFPGIGPSGIFEAYVKVLQTGEPVRLGPVTYQAPVSGVLCPVVLSVRAHRIGPELLLVSWQFLDHQARLAAHLRDVERMGRLGWAEWNLVTGETSWTGELYEIFRDRADRLPLALDEIPDHVHPEDAPDVRRALTALTELHRPQTFEFRVGERHIAATAEPVLDDLGRPIAFRGVMQDITARREVEEQLAQSRLELERQRVRLAEEMQRALLPEVRTDLPGLRVAVRYHPAENTAQVGGDWYEATALPDGRVLIVIGDASGHGLPAAARMAQLRNALLGVAFTGAGPAAILRCLNRLVLQVQEQTATATAVVAHFDPATRRLTWARAGHPAPILVRGGRARRLRNDFGPLLGATEEAVYRATTVALRPGDLVLLYTDGLVERRGGDLADPARALRRAAREGGGAPADPERMLAAFDIGNPEDDTCVLALQVLPEPR